MHKLETKQIGPTTCVSGTFEYISLIAVNSSLNATPQLAHAKYLHMGPTYQ